MQLANCWIYKSYIIDIVLYIRWRSNRNAFWLYMLANQGREKNTHWHTHTWNVFGWAEDVEIMSGRTSLKCAAGVEWITLMKKSIQLKISLYPTLRSWDLKLFWAGFCSYGLDDCTASYCNNYLTVPLLLWLICVNDLFKETFGPLKLLQDHFYGLAAPLNTVIHFPWFN